jgi:hypothetical protein
MLCRPHFALHCHQKITEECHSHPLSLGERSRHRRPEPPLSWEFRLPRWVHRKFLSVLPPSLSFPMHRSALVTMLRRAPIRTAVNHRRAPLLLVGLMAAGSRGWIRTKIHLIFIKSEPSEIKATTQINPRFFVREINLKTWEIPWILWFCRKTPLVYFIYVLVLAILQKQLWTFLKLYFCPRNCTFRSLYKFL